MSALFITNEGSVDRIVRVILGLVLLSLVFVGLVPLLTGLSGMCLIYRVFGISSCPVKR